MVNLYFCTPLAQVAELVDALVSNTNGANRAGSIPALGTKKPSEIWRVLYLSDL